MVSDKAQLMPCCPRRWWAMTMLMVLLILPMSMVPFRGTKSKPLERGGFEENESTNLFSMLPTPLGASIGMLLVERFVLIRAVSGSLVGDFLFYWDSILELVLSVCMCVCGMLYVSVLILVPYQRGNNAIDF